MTANSSDVVHDSAQILAVTMTAADASFWKRSAAIVAEQSTRVILAISCHWGSHEILFETHDYRRSSGPQLSADCRTAQEDVGAARRVLELLRNAGLKQSLDERERSSVINSAASCIRISVPAHFGVEFMLLVGAALRPLDSDVVFLGLCGAVDPVFRRLVNEGRLDELTQFARQLPKWRVTELYPLFVLIGASDGVVLGVLDRVVSHSGSRPDQSVATAHATRVLAPARKPPRTPVPLESFDDDGSAIVSRVVTKWSSRHSNE